MHGGERCLVGLVLNESHKNALYQIVEAAIMLFRFNAKFLNKIIVQTK
jgi:hypothetical protein